MNTVCIVFLTLMGIFLIGAFLLLFCANLREKRAMAKMGKDRYKREFISRTWTQKGIEDIVKAEVEKQLKKLAKGG